MWAANRNFAKVVKKSVKYGAKCNEMAQNFKTSYLGLGMNFLDIFSAQNYCLVFDGHRNILMLALFVPVAAVQCSNRATVKAFWPISPHLS